jgi:hypothetical protein
MLKGREEKIIPIAPTRRTADNSAALDIVMLSSHRLLDYHSGYAHIRIVAKLGDGKVMTWDTTDDKIGDRPVNLTFLRDRQERILTDAKTVVTSAMDFWR